jgi:hypothetical protein
MTCGTRLPVASPQIERCELVGGSYALVQGVVIRPGIFPSWLPRQRTESLARGSHMADPSTSPNRTRPCGIHGRRTATTAAR